MRSAGNNRADLSPEDGVDYCAWGTAGFETFNTTSTPRDDDCGSGGYDCISTAGTAKNILTISAVEDLLGGYPESGDPSAVVMTSFTGCNLQMTVALNQILSLAEWGYIPLSPRQLRGIFLGAELRWLCPV